MYRLHFRAEDSWREKTVRLLFDAVQRFSEVWLNGVKVGGHAYGYVPFLCDLTAALRYDGDNLLAVRVDNRAVPVEKLASADVPDVTGICDGAKVSVTCEGAGK